MNNLLNIKHGIPFEREYEAWIVDGIERYFQKFRRQVDIWAVSPRDEKIWPADEELSIDRKIIGLQMKRTLSSNPASIPQNMQDLHWKFNNPPNQHALISKREEIYYCLPTFLNRDCKYHSLDHCVFWRPETYKAYSQGWYGKQKKSRAYEDLGAEMRWGKIY